MKTVLIGAASDLGIHIDGARNGPKRLLEDLTNFYQGEEVILEQNSMIIKSRSLADKRKNQVEIQKFNATLYNTELKYLEDGYFPITVGGDASISIASCFANAMKNENIGLIYFCADARYHTFATTATGNIHDLCLAAINNYKCGELKSYHSGNVVLSKNTVIIGVQNMNRQLRDNIKYSGATVFTLEEIRRDGIESIMTRAFEIASEKTTAIHVGFDLGIFSPDVGLGVSIPEEDGISEEEGMAFLNSILTQIDKVNAFDLVEFSPERDIGRKTEQVAVNILAKVIMSAQRKN